MTKIINYEHKKIDEIVSQVHEFGIKYVMCSFDDENYLFTNYIYSDNMDSLVTIENHEGQKMYISNCNCGYNGNGPRNTRALLEGLGLSKPFADQTSRYNSFRLEFNEKNELISEQAITEMPFVSRKEYATRKNILINYDSMGANLAQKYMYFIQPRGESYHSLIKCMDIVSLQKVKIYIGNHNDKYFNFDIPYNLAVKNKNKKRVMEGSCIYFEAEPFGIVCLIGNESPTAFINSLYYYLTGKVMFLESRFGDLAVNELADQTMYTAKTRILPTTKILKKILFNICRSPELYYCVNLKKD